MTKTEKKPMMEVNLAAATPHIDFLKLGDYEGREIELLFRADAIYPYFDYEHATSVQRMAWVLLGHEETKPGEIHPALEDRKIDTLYNQRVLWLASYFHDIGRQAHWHDHHHDDANRSKDMFFAVMDAYPALREEEDGGLVADAAYVIGNRKKPTEVLSKVLHDADLMDAARIEPNTRQGMAYLQKAWGKDGKNFLTDFCRVKNHRDTVMRHAGWDF